MIERNDFFSSLESKVTVCKNILETMRTLPEGSPIMMELYFMKEVSRIMKDNIADQIIVEEEFISTGKKP